MYVHKSIGIKDKKKTGFVDRIISLLYTSIIYYNYK